MKIILLIMFMGMAVAANEESPERQDERFYARCCLVEQLQNVIEHGGNYISTSAWRKYMLRHINFFCLVPVQIPSRTPSVE